MDGFDGGEIHWSSGSNGSEEGSEAFTDEAISASQTGREWQRMATAISRALDCLNVSDTGACALLLAIARDTARENATMADAEADDTTLSAEERRRLQDGTEA